MAVKNSTYETSWADQWDPEPLYKNNYGSNYSGRTLSSGKVSDKLGKTKAVASTGMKKVKEGASAGVHWLKLKYQTSTGMKKVKEGASAGVHWLKLKYQKTTKKH